MHTGSPRVQPSVASVLSLRSITHTIRTVRKVAYVGNATMFCRAGSSSWRPWLLSLAMDVAASYSVGLGARLSQEAAHVAAAHPALRGASSAELCMLQVRRPYPGHRPDPTLTPPLLLTLGLALNLLRNLQRAQHS